MKKEEEKVKFRLFQDLIRPCIIGFALGWICMRFIGSSFYVTGTSMEPTIHDEQRCFLNKVTDYADSYNRCDVVVVEEASVNSKYIIKRIIGLPGESISIHDGHVYVNGDILDEPYITCEMADYDIYKYYNNVILEEDEYFIMGDNRNVSSDSRVFGPIKESQIVGTVIY